MAYPHRSKTLIIVLAALALAAFTLPAAAETGISNSGKGLVRMLSDGEPEWTPERMEAARPYPVPAPPGEAARVHELPVSATDRVPAFVPGSPGDGSLLEIEEGDASPLDSIEPLGYGYPAPYDRYKNYIRYGKYPFRTVGKLFFSQYGYDYVCSASVVGRRHIMTAGHCIHAGDGSASGWSSNVVFVPAYKKGNTPLGVWRAKAIGTTNGWYNGDFRWDYAGAIMRNIDGVPIGNVTGWLGFAWNQLSDQHWHSVGYPANTEGGLYPEFNGKLQWVCSASYAYSDSSMGLPYTRAIGCDATGGTSGGPWILNLKSGRSDVIPDLLNGVNSYRYTGLYKELFSPYFDTDTRNFHLWLLDNMP